MFIVSALSNIGTWNQASCAPQMQPFCKLGVLMHCLARTRKSLTIPIALHVFVTVFAMNEPDFSPLEQGSNWQHQLRLSRDTLWHQHYVRTGKEYLINCQILLRYFELLFFQLQLLQILCKLIVIWVNYEKNKKGSFYETPCIFSCCVRNGVLRQSLRSGVEGKGRSSPECETVFTSDSYFQHQT